MKRILILLITLGLLVGCSTTNNNKDSSIQESSKQKETQDSYNISGNYFGLGEEKIDLAVQPWYISLPKDSISKRADFCDYINFKNNQLKEIGALIISLPLDDNKEYSLKGVRKEFKSLRDNNMEFVIENGRGVQYQDNYKETTLNGDVALLDKGSATYNGKEVFQYAVFSMFLDKNHDAIAEVLLVSNDGVLADELEETARELISTLHKEE